MEKAESGEKYKGKPLASNLVARNEVLVPEPTARIPLATYRLQFHRSFTFADATRVVSYLDALGISDCYASPYFKANPGSPHGYDVIDHNALDPEVGSAEEYEAFVQALRQYDMGQILESCLTTLASPGAGIPAGSMCWKTGRVRCAPTSSTLTGTP